jgi:hypothetical protein
VLVDCGGGSGAILKITSHSHLPCSKPEDYGPDPESEGKDPAAVALGRKGGKARAAGLSAKRRKEIAKIAAKKRWK